MTVSEKQLQSNKKNAQKKGEGELNHYGFYIDDRLLSRTRFLSK